MKCTEIQILLDEYLDEVLSTDEQKSIESHVDQCTSCHQILDENRAIRRALHALPVAEASPDFEKKMFATVHSHYGVGTERSGNRFFAGFSTAIAASLAIWFASTMYVTQFDDASPQVINLAMSQARTVRLVFEAPADLNEVTLSVVLPENVELEGYAGQKQIVWQTKLNKGQNILALPVTAVNHGQGDLVARLSYGDITKQFHIVIKTTSDGALIYQFNQLKTA